MLVPNMGSIKIVSMAPNGIELMKLMYELYRGEGRASLLNIAQVQLLVRAPIFVHLSIAAAGLNMFPARSGAVEIFTPDITMIGAKTPEISEGIRASMEQAANAAKLNTEAYVMDGCDTFVASINMPISTISSVLICGQLSKWMEWTRLTTLPVAVEPYRREVQLLLDSEYEQVLHKIRSANGGVK